jgi:hypothetical protein
MHQGCANGASPIDQLRSMSSPLLHFLRAFVSGGESNFE